MPGKKILVIDADAASRAFIAKKLHDQNHEVIQAGAGKEGLIFAWRDHPDLVIVDPVLADVGGEEIASKLRHDARTAKIPLVALSSDPDPARRMSCKEAGFNEYILKSGQAVQMLSDALDRLFGFSGEAMKQGGLLITFLSAKGGAGTSSLCANIAMNIPQHQPEARVVVADLVLPIGSIAPIVGYEDAQNIVSVTNLPAEQTSSEFFRSELPAMEIWRFSLLAGSPDPESSNQLNVNRIWNVIAALKDIYDFVLVDIGRSLSKITLPLIQHADLVVLVVSTDASALPLTQTLLTYLRDKGISSDAIYPILNRVGGLEGLSKADVENAIGMEVRVSFPYLGTNFAFANSHHQPFSLKFPQDTASIIFQDAAREMASLAQAVRTK
jgi:pilus assembly protein CpaE